MASPDEPEGPVPPVAVVVADTLRADMTEEPILLDRLPTLRRLFGESYLFTRAYAPSHWTLPSHASLFTGLPPHVHGARPPEMRLRAESPTLAEVFRRAGYRTACVTCNPWLSAVHGMTRGFDDVWQPSLLPLAARLHAISDWLANLSNGDGGPHPWMGLAQRVAALVLSTPAADNGARALRRGMRNYWEPEGRPPFLLINLMEAHGPYQGRGSFAAWEKRMAHHGVFGRWERLKFSILAGRVPITEPMRRDIDGIYWENVQYLDRQLGHLLDEAPRAFLEDGYLVLVSDHGQLLGEDDRIDHAAGLYEPLIRVPLAIRPPGGNGSARVGHPVDISWLYRLLEAIARGDRAPMRRWLDWVARQGVVVSEASGGIVPHVDRLRGRDADFRRDLLAFRSRHDHPALAAVGDRWKLICHLGRTEDELYDLRADPGEKVNRMEEEKETVDELHRELRARFLGETRSPEGPVRRDELPLETKRAVAETVLREALTSPRKAVLVWTGGKDSNLLLHLATDVARREGLPPPRLMLVDHGTHFPETWDFLDRVAEATNASVLVVRNEPLVEALRAGRESVPLDDLDGENQEEALKAGLEGKDVPLDLNTAVGNHLLKTVALKRALREHGFNAVISGIRWDENPARAREVFFSPREDPPHTRVHPILPWTERDVWTYTREHDLPVHPLYERGYRSFDGIHDSEPTDTRPAWEQDLEGTVERAGRAQDKEEIMRRLRALGYF